MAGCDVAPTRTYHARLISLYPAAATDFEMCEDVVWLGRCPGGADGQHRIVECRSESRTHARIFKQNGTHFIEVLVARPVWIGYVELKLGMVQRLHRGDCIRFSGRRGANRCQWLAGFIFWPSTSWSLTSVGCQSDFRWRTASQYRRVRRHRAEALAWHDHYGRLLSTYFLNQALEGGGAIAAQRGGAPLQAAGFDSDAASDTDLSWSIAAGARWTLNEPGVSSSWWTGSPGCASSDVLVGGWPEPLGCTGDCTGWWGGSSAAAASTDVEHHDQTWNDHALDATDTWDLPWYSVSAVAGWWHPSSATAYGAEG